MSWVKRKLRSIADNDVYNLLNVKNEFFIFLLFEIFQFEIFTTNHA